MLIKKTKESKISNAKYLADIYQGYKCKKEGYTENYYFILDIIKDNI